ncbi:MAG TPA: 5-(carboxyamino)imidazole ribonucleotide synthase [Luteolibacter sp.]|nr:5-(carboxyamino)imidazole ribonucleotide synthase [Luteolibacter sp.]
MKTPRLDLKHTCIGVIGGGQLGRMLVMAARRMNLRSVVWTGALEAPAACLADEVVDLPFDDPAALARFCTLATVATVEFENIPVAVLEAVEAQVPIHPSPQCVSICQNRAREKAFLSRHAIPCAPHALVRSAGELAAAIEQLGPGMLKTADFGYDGNGQIRVRGDEDAGQVWEHFAAPAGIYEQWVSYEKELSIMVARGADGEVVCHDVVENRHREQILDLTIAPAQVPVVVADQAAAIARRIVEAMDYRGIMGVEFFLLPGGGLVVNEMAPRPHNSGHHTMNACITSQFEQQLRAVLGLPLGSTRLVSPVVMLNLLGDLWPAEGSEPDWNPLFADGAAHLHLYGKSRASARRKMGHANFLGTDALPRALALKQRWLAEAGAEKLASVG